MAESFISGEMVGTKYNQIVKKIKERGKSMPAEEKKKAHEKVDAIFAEVEGEYNIPVLNNLSDEDDHPLNKQISTCAKLFMGMVENPDESQEASFNCGSEEPLRVKVVCRRSKKKVISLMSFCVLYENKEGKKEWVEIARTPWAAACYVVAFVRGKMNL